MNKKKIFFRTFFIFFICFFIFSSFFVYCDDIDYDEEILDIASEIENITMETSSNIDSNTLTLNSRSCAVLDRKTKQILYGKNEKNRVKMASTTKIMTATVVLENCSLNKTVEILMRSGNDAAVALAETVSGSVQEFANLMNQKAKELGLSNTSFESPHGLDSDNHYTTAYELAILTDYALKNSTFLNIVGTKNYTVTINGYPKKISNTNELLGNLNGVYGVKTGFTNGANRCLVTSCKRGDMDIICVVLGADTKSFRTKDSIKLIEYTFQNFEYFNLKDYVSNYLENWKKEHPHFFFVEKGLSNYIDIKMDSSIEKTPIIPIEKDSTSELKISMNVNPYLSAPIKKDDILGTLIVSYKNHPVLNLNLLSNSTIHKASLCDYLLRFFKDYTNQLENFLLF